MIQKELLCQKLYHHDIIQNKNQILSKIKEFNIMNEVELNLFEIMNFEDLTLDNIVHILMIIYSEFKLIWNELDMMIFHSVLGINGFLYFMINPNRKIKTPSFIRHDHKEIKKFDLCVLLYQSNQCHLLQHYCIKFGIKKNYHSLIQKLTFGPKHNRYQSKYK